MRKNEQEKGSERARAQAQEKVRDIIYGLNPVYLIPMSCAT